MDILAQTREFALPPPFYSILVLSELRMPLTLVKLDLFIQSADSYANPPDRHI